MKKKTLHYLWSINCINVCIRGYNCCQTGIELSKCVYLASMGVKINHTVGGQNQEIFQNAYLMVMPVKHGSHPKKKLRNLMFCPLKLNGIYRKLNKIVFGCKFCHSCHLGRLAAIIIDILFNIWDIYISATGRIGSTRSCSLFHHKTKLKNVIRRIIMSYLKIWILIYNQTVVSHSQTNHFPLFQSQDWYFRGKSGHLCWQTWLILSM